MLRELFINGGKANEVSLTRRANGARIWLNGKPLEASLSPSGDGWVVTADGRSVPISLVVDRDKVLIHAFGRTWRIAVEDPAERALLAGNQSDVAKAPMPGVTVNVMVAAGDQVTSGQTLLIIESMKMQMEIKSSRDGEVAHVDAREGESFTLGAPLVTLVPLEVAEA
jgi:biotin carboxyl carrier protein